MMKPEEKKNALSGQAEEAGGFRRLAGADQGNPTCTARHTPSWQQRLDDIIDWRECDQGPKCTTGVLSIALDIRNTTSRITSQCEILEQLL